MNNIYYTYSLSKKELNKFISKLNKYISENDTKILETIKKRFYKNQQL